MPVRQCEEFLDGGSELMADSGLEVANLQGIKMSLLLGLPISRAPQPYPACGLESWLLAVVGDHFNVSSSILRKKIPRILISDCSLTQIRISISFTSTDKEKTQGGLRVLVVPSDGLMDNG